MDILVLNSLLLDTGIRALSTQEHAKASEAVVEIEVFDSQTGEKVWAGAVPYVYRRSGLSLQTEEELADYLNGVRQFLEPRRAREWIADELKEWQARNAHVTFEFFKKLASLRWVKQSEFPANRNPQRRLQDIKDMGYVIATRRQGRNYERLLVPLPRHEAHEYETIDADLRRRIIDVLRHRNVYEDSSATRIGLLPDHKFPEVRWDSLTSDENFSAMSNEQIQEKFQLLDNQRNQQKREVCRSCFQTSRRGTVFGINYFYQGGPEWPPDVPIRGKAAEAGCVGCGWYDIQAWRQSLNDYLNKR